MADSHWLLPQLPALSGKWSIHYPPPWLHQEENQDLRRAGDPSGRGAQVEGGWSHRAPAAELHTGTQTLVETHRFNP